MPTPITERVAESEGWGQAPQPGPALPMATGTTAPCIGTGTLIILRQFDVADEIDLSKARLLEFPERLVPARPRTTALLLSNPPMVISLGRKTVALASGNVDCDVFARIFDFGAISIRFRTPLREGTNWTELSALAADAQTAQSPTHVARGLMRELVQRLGAAMDGAHDSDLFEDYVILSIDKFAGDATLAALPVEAIAQLLLGESRELSASEVVETTRYRSSYYGDDLCVTGWNVALVVEPRGDSDPIDVIELANAQLLELRHYDGLLDRELAQLYDEVGRGRKRPTLLRNYGPVLRRAMMLMLGIAECIERAENALKIIGDVYLARLYGAAVSALRIQSWERAVTRKQALVQQVYDVLKSEVDTRRAQVLEVIVIALIVGEMLLAFHW